MATDSKEYTVLPVTIGPVIKGTQEANHIKLWSKIKSDKSKTKKNHILLISRIKILGDTNYSANDYCYALPCKSHKYITLIDYSDLQEHINYEYQIGYIFIKKNIIDQGIDIHEFYSNIDWTFSSYGTFNTGDCNTNSDCTSFIFGSCRKWIKIGGKEIYGLGSSADGVYGAIRNHNIDFFLSIGDQIYLDPICNNILQCKSLKSMITRYDKVRSYENIRNLMANTITYEICDDHDHLCNDSNYNKRHKYDRIYKNAIKAYIYYQSIQGPESYSVINNVINHEPLYYTFERDKASFFVMDTRDERDEREMNNKKIISKSQFIAIQTWLDSNVYSGKVLFLVSPTPVLSLNTQDSWFGYPQQQAKLCNMLTTSNIKNIFILTGDCHCCRVGVYQLGSSANTLLTEIISSGFASLNHCYGKEFKIQTPDTEIDINEYDTHNDFPYILNNIAHEGIKLTTYYATSSYPQRNDTVTKGVFTKITIKESLTIEILNQQNNLLETCFFKLIDDE